MVVFAALAALSACATGSAPAPDASVTLERSVCYGFCPAYAVTIYGDGRVAYEGRQFVRVSGAQSGQADPAEVAALFAMIEDANFFALNDAYRANITDLPEYSVTVRQGGRSKTVVDYVGRAAGMPEAVTLIENEIDRVAGTRQWVERDDRTPPWQQ